MDFGSAAKMNSNKVIGKWHGLAQGVMLKSVLWSSWIWQMLGYNGELLLVFDSCREWGQGAEMFPRQWHPLVIPASTLPTVFLNILTFSFKKKKGK